VSHVPVRFSVEFPVVFCGVQFVMVGCCSVRNIWHGSVRWSRLVFSAVWYGICGAARFSSVRYVMLQSVIPWFGYLLYGIYGSA
jgi:hypothetical protein